MTTIYRDKDGKRVKTDPGTRPAGARKPKPSAPAKPAAPATPAGATPRKKEK